VISNTVRQKLAGGKNSHFVDLILVGDVDKLYMIRMIEKVEELIGKKIRIAVFYTIVEMSCK
jgi:hypothetical protein